MITSGNSSKTRKGYRIQDIFRYSDTSKLRIVGRLLLLGVYQLIGKRSIITKVNNYHMELDLGTPGLSRVLFVYGKRELLDTYVVQQEVHGNMHVLEVGANIGYYAMLEASQLTSGKVYALEPDPRNIDLLRKNIVLNDVKDKVEVFPYAASDSNETKQFHLGERTNVSSFVEGHASAGSLAVPCIALENFVYIHEVDFIRMDVEGYECKVIEGMKSVLQDTIKPLSIFLEVHYSAYNNTDLNFKKQLDYLLGQGFKTKYIISAERTAHHFSDRGYVPVKRAVETRYARCLYTDIKEDDARYFFDKGIVRSLLLKR